MEDISLEEIFEKGSINKKIKISNFKCFGEKEEGFDRLKPINIIIGRNNSGKSSYVDIIEIYTTDGTYYDPSKHGRTNSTFNAHWEHILTDNDLRTTFHENASGGAIAGSHWAFGQQFLETKIQIVSGPPWNHEIKSVPKFSGDADPEQLKQMFSKLASRITPPLSGYKLQRIAAERDVVPETRSEERDVVSTGIGTTNLIRAFINSDSLPREKVESELLEDLNKIYLGDSNFAKIFCEENENGVWEILLQENQKGNVRLSQSGSSLKTIFIILCFILLKPNIEKIDWKKIIFAIEEPENNIHPSLLRRLLDFLAIKRNELGFTLVLTTHSPISIDWAASRTDSQIIHVKHDNEFSSSKIVVGYPAQKEILDDLEIRASELLQANGIVWVEGPTDRLYLRHWINLASNGELKEGTHYSIMFYAGRLLSHLKALPATEEDALISLVSINRNTAVLIDSDRYPSKNGKRAVTHLNKTKTRIRDEVQNAQGFVWITQGREIENYIPAEVLQRISGKRVPRTVDRYTKIPEHSVMQKFKGNKVAIAHAAINDSNASDFANHLDLWPQVNSLITKIRSWNGAVK